MEHSQNNIAKVLMIVEGESLEPKFFEQLKKVFGIGVEIYMVGANIYRLYQELEKYEFNCDIKDILPDIGNHIEGIEELLSQRYAYTYLVFDFDAHHRERGEEGLDIDTIVSNNVEKLEKMAAYFVDETDPSIGKLYINYPMMESYRDASCFFDEGYRDNEITIDDIGQYKSIAGKKCLASINVKRYTRENFADLTRMNVFKLYKICVGKWAAMTYEEYTSASKADVILGCQAERVRRERILDVINTSLFLVVDYFGNQKGFFDHVMTGEVPSKNDSEMVLLT